MVGDAGGAAATRALTLVGGPFLLGGRDPATGVDCIGLVLAAYRFAPPPSLPPGATLGASTGAPWLRGLAEAGFVPAEGANRPGDLHFLDAGRGRRHLALWAGTLFVHAHAGLGRVVASRTLPDMACLSRWRLATGGDFFN